MSGPRLDGFTPISSGHLDGCKYSSMDRTLHVRFSNGSIYEVSGVSPEDHQAFLNAPSAGEHYHAVLKPNYHIERVR